MQTSADSVETVRDARLEARITSDLKSLLQRAAALSGRTLSEFVVASAHEAATRILHDNDAIVLSRAEQVAFVTALLKPPRPSARLREAAARYRQQMGL